VEQLAMNTKFAIALLLLSAAFTSGQTKKSETWAEPDGFLGVPFNAGQAEARSKLDLKCDGEGTCTYDLRLMDLPLRLFFNFDDRDKLGRVFANFRSSSFEVVRGVFVQRYGKPTQVSTQTVTTALGDRIEIETCGWIGENVSIALTKYFPREGETVREGIFMVFLNDYLEERIRKATQKL
jgi:hypothetical protein